MVGRVRVRSKSKIRVQSGMACESNPTKSRHREAAMNARNASMMANDLVAVDDRGPQLGGPAENILDDIPLDNMSIGNGRICASNKSMVSDGGITRLSAFTSCTNPAFDSVHRFWESGSSMQTEVISVLAAVAELIRERNGKETDLEYFAALLTALEGTPVGEPIRTNATAYLLQLIVKKVPKDVLQSQFTKATQVLYTKLLENNDSADGTVLRNLLAVLGAVLRAQPAAVWQSAYSRNMIVSIAGMCTHDKPFVRSMSRRVVRIVLADPVTAMDNGLHAASAGVGTFVHQHLEAALDAKNGAANAVRYLCLLEGVLHKMPSNLFKQLAESILKSFAFADSMVKCSALQCMHRALQKQPCDAALSVDVNSLIITALRQLAPPANDISVSAYWMQALAEAHVCLSAKDPVRSNELLPTTLKMVVATFESANEQLAQITYQVLSRVIEMCVQDNEQCARGLLELLDQALVLQSTTVWKFVLRTQMRLFETAGEGIVGPEFTKALESLAQLRQSDQCFCKAELDFTIGSAVRHVGVAHVLEVLPLLIDADSAVLALEFPRSWLIPVLRVNIHNAPMALFSSVFLPLAIKIYRRLPTLDDLPRRLYQTLQMQIWDLLPSFCESPSDIEKTFPDIAPVLGAAFNERKDLRQIILAALRRVCRFALQPDSSAESTEIVSQYAKNFMPLLFNVYTNTVENEYDDKAIRLSVLETIRIYAEVTPPVLVTRFISSAIDKWTEASKDEKNGFRKQPRILDILCALVRCADASSIEVVLDAINPWFSATDDANNQQKKAYRILEEVLTRRSDPELERLFDSRAQDFENAVIIPIDNIVPPARAAMVSCIHILMKSKENVKELTDFALQTVTNVVLCLEKANSTHARTNASKCMQFLCNQLIELGAETEEQPSIVLSPVLSRIFEMATAAPGDTAEICTELARGMLVALNIITQKHIKVLNATLISRVISHSCAWLSDDRGPVRIIAIRLLRVLTEKMPDFAMHQYRELLLTSIFDGQSSCDLTVKVRKANRLLLEALVEKFGGDVLQKYTQKPDWVKQIKNIEKLRRRKAAKARGEKVEAESDDENQSTAGSRVSARTAGADTILDLLGESDDDDSEANMDTRSRHGSVWLRDDNEGETTDLLDRSNMINKVTTMDPALIARRNAKSLEKKKNKDLGFRFTKDGKIIIGDDDEEKSRRKRKNGLDELDEGEGGKRKRVDSDAESDDYEDSDDGKTGKARSSVKSMASTSFKSRASSASSWRPGGQGIHRDTSKREQKKSAKGDSTKKGQAVQPYAYVPLRKKGGKQDIRKILKAQRKSGKGKVRSK